MFTRITSPGAEIRQDFFMQLPLTPGSRPPYPSFRIELRRDARLLSADFLFETRCPPYIMKRTLVRSIAFALWLPVVSYAALDTNRIEAVTGLKEPGMPLRVCSKSAAPRSDVAVEGGRVEDAAVYGPDFLGRIPRG
jgi:hypothetical protein